MNQQQELDDLVEVLQRVTAKLAAEQGRHGFGTAELARGYGALAEYHRARVGQELWPSDGFDYHADAATHFDRLLERVCAGSRVMTAFPVLPGPVEPGECTGVAGREAARFRAPAARRTLTVRFDIDRKVKP